MNKVTSEKVIVGPREKNLAEISVETANIPISWAGKSGMLMPDCPAQGIGKFGVFYPLRS